MESTTYDEIMRELQNQKLFYRKLTGKTHNYYSFISEFDVHGAKILLNQYKNIDAIVNELNKQIELKKNVEAKITEKSSSSSELIACNKLLTQIKFNINALEMIMFSLECDERDKIISEIEKQVQEVDESFKDLNSISGQNNETNKLNEEANKIIAINQASWCIIS